MSRAPAETREHGSRQRRDGEDHRSLSGREKRTVALLGVPTMALALAVTVVTTYLPVVARPFVDSTVVIGLIIGLEGVVALWLPLVSGRGRTASTPPSGDGCRS